MRISEIMQDKWFLLDPAGEWTAYCVVVIGEKSDEILAFYPMRLNTGIFRCGKDVFAPGWMAAGIAGAHFYPMGADTVVRPRTLTEEEQAEILALAVGIGEFPVFVEVK